MLSLRLTLISQAVWRLQVEASVKGALVLLLLGLLKGVISVGLQVAWQQARGFLFTHTHAHTFHVSCTPSLAASHCLSVSAILWRSVNSGCPFLVLDCKADITQVLD